MSEVAYIQIGMIGISLTIFGATVVLSGILRTLVKISNKLGEIAENTKKYGE